MNKKEIFEELKFDLKFWAKIRKQYYHNRQFGNHNYVLYEHYNGKLQATKNIIKYFLA